MDLGLRFGVVTLQNAPCSALMERWRYLDKLDFYSAWVADHFVNPFPERALPVWVEASVGPRRTSPTRAVSVSQIRATTYRPPCAPKADGGYKADHTQGRIGVQVGDAECHVAGRVDGVEYRVEERHHLEHAGQHTYGVEHPAQERKRLDDDARDERDVLYPSRQGADHRAKRREREGGQKSDHHEHQRVFDLYPDERHPDDEDPGPHHQSAQHTAQRVGEGDLQVAHRADEHLVYVALALGVEDRPGRVHLRVGDQAHQGYARQYVIEVGDALYLLYASAECDPEDHQIQKRGQKLWDYRLHPDPRKAQYLA